MKDYNPKSSENQVVQTKSSPKRPINVRLFKIAGTIVTLSTLVLVIYCLTYLPSYFEKTIKPEKIEITGNKILSINTILSTLSISKDTHWIDLDPYELTSKLDNQPWIDDAIVHRKPDLGFSIQIKEVVPFLFIKSKDKIFMLNDKYRILSLVQSGEGWKLPVVVNNNINELIPGDQIADKYVYKAIELINILKNNTVLPLNVVSEIDVSDPFNIQLITIPNATVIKLGATDFEEKLNNLKFVIPVLKEEEDNLRYIDLRYKNAVVFRRKI